MSELTQWIEENDEDEPIPSGFNAMGEEIPLERKSTALEHCKSMGLDSQDAWDCIGAIANKLERDLPYEAQQEGMEYLDYYGVYRVFAVLLAEPVEEGE